MKVANPDSMAVLSGSGIGTQQLLPVFPERQDFSVADSRIAFI